jgi:hypothetical protein
MPHLERVFSNVPCAINWVQGTLVVTVIPRSTDSSSLNWIFIGVALARTKHQKLGSVLIYINSELHLRGIASALSKEIVLVVMRWEETIAD